MASSLTLPGLSSSLRPPATTRKQPGVKQDACTMRFPPTGGTRGGGYAIEAKWKVSGCTADLAQAIALRPAPSELLKLCGGFYECPKAPNGKRRGPLVGYAGRDERGRQFVGDAYINFAAVERHGIVLRTLAEQLQSRLAETHIDRIDGFCGAPEGGKALATILSVLGERQYIFPE